MSEERPGKGAPHRVERDEDTSLRRAALDYVARGWPVFPVTPRGKQPHGVLAPHGFKDAVTDAERVAAWWSECPNANIGVPTGVRFDVLDLDGDDAVDWFLDLCRQHHGFDPCGPRSITGRGGRHVFVQATGERSRTGIVPHVDWRGIGGYVVMPPSVHPTGRTYRWKHELLDGAAPPAPEWLLQMIRPPAVPRRTSALPPRSCVGAYATAALTGEWARVRLAPKGVRNSTLNLAAWRLGRFVGAGLLRAEQVENILTEGGRACGLPDDEVESTIRSGLTAGMRDPRVVAR